MLTCWCKLCVMVFDGKSPEQLNEDELMSLAMLLRDLKDASSENPYNLDLMVKAYAPDDINGGKQEQSYYYAVREKVNRGKPEMLQYLVVNGCIEGYHMLQMNPAKLDYQITLNHSSFNTFYSRVMALTLPYVEKLIDQNAGISKTKLTPKSMASRLKRAVLDINGFNSPIVHIHTDSYTMPNMKYGKARDIIMCCYQKNGQLLTLEDVKAELKTKPERNDMGLTSLTQALRRSQFDQKQPGALAVFVAVSPQEIMLEAIKDISQIQVDLIAAKSVN